MARSEESEPALVVPTALVFVMLGGLLSVWGGVWLSYENHLPESSRAAYRVCAGLIVTGIAMIAIGLSIGRMALRTRSLARKGVIPAKSPVDRET